MHSPIQRTRRQVAPLVEQEIYLDVSKANRLILQYLAIAHVLHCSLQQNLHPVDFREVVSFRLLITAPTRTQELRPLEVAYSADLVGQRTP